MIYYKTTLHTYNKFIKEYKTNRLSKNEKLEDPTSGVVKFLKLEKIKEIFNYRINSLDYKEEKYKHPEYEAEENITFFFKSKSNTEYRLDFVILIEGEENIKDRRLKGKKFISVSFSLSNSNYEDYDKQTNLDEIYDLMSRIRYIIELNEYRVKDDYVFMFGKPSDNKIKMYQYFIKICFPDYEIIKDYTSGFPTTNVGYYLLK
jgi:hypothetical protein